jgi:hypothetical protein
VRRQARRNQPTRGSSRSCPYLRFARDNLI